ncbi:MAG: hypothetical protein HOW73_49600 [Polyangiaceae bacterium]|nr:hypothetical protein [Polyangiaceae bacterium]
MPPATIRKPTLDQAITDAGGPVPSTVLVVCGQMMRQSRRASSARPEETERALRALSPDAVVTALAAIDVTSVKSELTRAVEESFEAALAEEAQERTMFATSAMSGLAARDKVASTLTAARARLDLLQKDQGQNTSSPQSEGARALSDAIASTERAIADIDASLRVRSRSLTGVNRERRAELAKLDPQERERCWWYADRSDEGDDDLLVALADLPGGKASVTRLGPAAQADIGASALIDLNMEAASSALRRIALGAATAEERAWIAKHAAVDASLKQALDVAQDTQIERGED